MQQLLRIGLLILPLLCAALAQTRDTQANFQTKQPGPDRPPVVSLDPVQLSFNDQVIQRPTNPTRVTLTNSGEKSLYVNSAVINGESVQDFIISKDTCTGANVPPGKSCVVDITFTPSEKGNRKAVLTFNDNAVDSPQRIIMTGNGINSVEEPPK